MITPLIDRSRERIPLSTRANAAWTLAWRARHNANWGQMLDAKNRILWLRFDPHPLVRRIAEDCIGAAHFGGDAA